MADAPPPYSAAASGEKGYPPPNQGAYPPQGGYPPQQGGYPPQQGGYPPQQGGYPPQGGPPQGYPPQAGYPPPQGGYQAGPPSGCPQPGYGQPPAGGGTTHNTVVVTQPALTVVQTFREAPTRTMCPHCRADIVTATNYESGTFSWLICVILCLVGCNLGCCLIPFCVDSCQDVIHSCPNCRQQISRFGRM